MLRTIQYSCCPVCSSTQIQEVLTAKDYTVSEQLFAVWHCQSCTARFTQQVPTQEHIGPYYNSAAYISHSNTNKGIINKIYQLVRNYTLRKKLALLQKYTGLRTGNLLDVGAGIGAFAHTVQQAGWQVTGLEPDATAVANAQTLYGLQLLPLQQLFTLSAASFNAITLWHVLEHVHDLHGYMQQFGKVLAPGGVLVIAVPNYTSADAAHYGAAWAAYDVPRHLYHFSPQSIQQLASKHGFTVRTQLPMLFDSFYVSMLSEQYKNHRSNLLAAFWQGLVSNAKRGKQNQHCSSVIYILAKA
jgi:2-polyprenyl-3-methyl-5-hydroxy-6-metoxy-1,4-benzoquinol methylase